MPLGLLNLCSQTSWPQLLSKGKAIGIKQIFHTISPQTLMLKFKFTEELIQS